MQGGHGGKGVLGRGDRGLRSSNLKGKAADAEGAQVQVVPKDPRHPWVVKQRPCALARQQVSGRRDTCQGDAYLENCRGRGRLYP